MLGGTIRKLFVSLSLMLPGAAFAQDCGEVIHTVQEGETIFTISETYYGSQVRWSLIFYGNQQQLGTGGFDVKPGTKLNIPCQPGMTIPEPDARPLEQDDAAMRILTGGNFAPFTDRNWLGDGMITELVNAAMEVTPDPVTYSITWEDDWSKHLFPMLDSKEFDMGFPWYKPNCEENRDHDRCKNFHFSDPILELLNLLFVKEGSNFTFETDEDAHGRRLCRPAGYFTFDMERSDRQWLTNNLIELEQPATPAECFELLMEGQVDAVALNEFTGRATLSGLGLGDEVAPLARPLSVQGLHVIISKRHWRGTSHLYRINAGLRALKESNRYGQIISRHLGQFNSEFR